MLSVHNKIWGNINTKKSRTYAHINLVKKNNDNNNDKLQYLPKSLISQKYKKIFSRKIRLVAIPSGFYTFGFYNV